MQQRDVTLLHPEKDFNIAPGHALIYRRGSLEASCCRCLDDVEPPEVQQHVLRLDAA